MCTNNIILTCTYNIRVDRLKMFFFSNDEESLETKNIRDGLNNHGENMVIIRKKFFLDLQKLLHVDSILFIKIFFVENNRRWKKMLCDAFVITKKKYIR